MNVTDKIQAIVSKRSEAWIALSRRNLFLSSSRGGSTAFHRPDDLSAEAEQLALSGTNPEALEVICAELSQIESSHACLIDVARAARLLFEQGLPPVEAVRRSRVRYMGTDGVRGRIGAAGDSETALQAFTETRTFVPDLCRILSASLISANTHEGQSKVVIAEDGRDAFAGREFIRAAIDGFAVSGCDVIDLGIAPTPLVPAAMAMLGAKYGAVVTASHNPSNQNGIKFFKDCRKLLPEPDDYILSAFAFKACLEGDAEPVARGMVQEADAWPLLKRYMTAAFSENDAGCLGGSSFIVDAAYGAFSPFARHYMDAVGLESEAINVDMTGDNINQFSGVAYLEGKDAVEEADIPDEIEIIGKTLAAQKNRDSAVFGIALDGDGDRGLLLVPDRDSVYILDGDRMGYIITKYMLSTNGAENRVFAGTVESDLNVFGAVEELGISSRMTGVGDKWLTSVPELSGNLLLGVESSGHLARPVQLTGEGALVITGNGMLTCLWAAHAIRELGLSPDECAEPFTPGIMETNYTYFVDKSRFFRDGMVWRSDLKIAEQAMREYSVDGSLPLDTKLERIDFPHDEDMLYLKLEAGGKTVGAVFVRNSGTENKTGSYARGLQTFAEPITGIASALNRNHIKLLKDESLSENAAGGEVVARVEKQGQWPVDDALKILENCGICGKANGNALIYALLKEKRLKRRGEVLIPVAPNAS